MDVSRGAAHALEDRASDFFTRPASARPLAALRLGLSIVLLLQAVALAPTLLELYGSGGFVQWPIAQTLAPPGVPRIAWLIEVMAPWGVRAEDCVRGVFLLYVGSLACLLLGWHTRAAAAVAWLGHLTLCVSGSAGVYGVDTFARIGLFYCVVMPVGHALSLDRADGRVPQGPTSLARLGLRVLQIHLCIAYFAAGVAKAAGEQWRTGEAIWLALNQPTLARFDATWLASAPWLAALACWGTIAIEAAYPVFIWPRATRVPWALLMIGLHIGIGIGMGLVSFAAVMIVLNVAAFLVSPEPGDDPGIFTPLSPLRGRGVGGEGPSARATSLGRQIRSVADECGAIGSVASCGPLTPTLSPAAGERESALRRGSRRCPPARHPGDRRREDPREFDLD